MWWHWDGLKICLISWSLTKLKIEMKTNTMLKDNLTRCLWTIPRNILRLRIKKRRLNLKRNVKAGMDYESIISRSYRSKLPEKVNAFHLDLRLFRSANKCRLNHARKCRCVAVLKGWWLMKKIFRLMCLHICSSFKKFVLWLFHKFCVKSRFQCYKTMSRYFVILTSAVTAQVNRCQNVQICKIFPENCPAFSVCQLSVASWSLVTIFV